MRTPAGDARTRPTLYCIGGVSLYASESEAKRQQTPSTYAKIILSAVFVVIGYAFYLMSQYAAMKYQNTSTDLRRAYFYTAFVGIGIMLLGQILALGNAVVQAAVGNPIISIFDQNAFKNQKAFVKVGFWMIIIGGTVLCMQNIVFLAIMGAKATDMSGSQEQHFVIANLINSVLNLVAYGMIAFIHSKKFRDSPRNLIQDNIMIIIISGLFIITMIAVAVYYSVYLNEQKQLQKQSGLYI